MKISSATFAVAAVLLSSSAVYAQDSMVSAPGYPVGERAVLHPSATAETGFTSNVFYTEANDAVAALFRLGAQLKIEPVESSSNEPKDIDFSAGARLEYNEFLSSNGNARAQRNLGIGLDGSLTFKPGSTVPITLEDHFQRVNRPTNFESNRILARNTNILKVGARYQPEGRNISGRTHFQNTIDAFESSNSQFANRLLNEIGLGVDWQFLPITRFYVEGSYGFNSGLGSASTKVSSNPIRGKLGVATAITESFTTRAHVGYAYGAYSTGASFSGVTYGGELGYRYSPVGRVTLAFDRDFRDSINANFFGDYAFKLAVNQQVERVMLEAKAGLRLRSYGGVSMDFGGGDTRDDLIVSLGARAGYVLKDWLSLTANYDFTSVQTDFVSMVDNETDDPSFTRHQLLVGANAAF